MKLSSLACASDSSASETQIPRKTNEDPTMGMIVAGVACLFCTLALFLGAFMAVPADTEVGIQCAAGAAAESVGSETLQTFLIFALGYLGTLAWKRRCELAQQIYRMCCLMHHAVSSARAAVNSTVFTVANVHRRIWVFLQPAWMSKGVIYIVMAFMLCATCIVSLLISAFTAIPDADPADDGLASETSTFMRVFTVGWMFILSFKLRSELIGLVGSGFLLQPW